MASTNPARGTRDFLPADVRKRNYVIGIIKDVYESYGFEPLETPAFENLETLTGKYGEEGGQLMFKILKRGEKLDISSASNAADLADLALRYDLTVPLARVVANNRNELPKFFKRYQIQPVWRADRPARGRYREFYQCDVDAIGSESLVVEAEMLAAACKVLDRLEFRDFVVKVNHRSLLAAFLSALNIPFANHVAILTALDKLDKGGMEVLISDLEQLGYATDVVDRVVSFLEEYEEQTFSSLQLQPRQWNLEKLDELSRRFGDLSVANEAIADLRNVFLYLEEMIDAVQFNVRFDLSLVRGLSYYTGCIFEIVLTNGDFKGSIGGGGRYDGLIGMFGKEQIPACGISLGLERILVVMDERGMFPPEIADSTPADVMITIWSEETAAESLKLAAELRAAGLRVTVYPEADKLGKQIKYADSIRVPFVCVLGESEIGAGKVTVKNMRTGAQQSVDRGEVGKSVRVADDSI
ncbi:MAG TPA: histidine--tRNA ligase [Pyrinomonadaceae bacterium]|nr:histidine--tRNA ligase [Pyrinomonadaceae bacterium]